MKIYSIYRFKNKITNKVYIGWSGKPSARFRYHKYAAYTRKDSGKFYNAIRKYGIDNFDFIIIYQSMDELHIKNIEPYFITLYDSFKNGYNMSAGGEGQTGFRHSEKTIDEFKKRIPWNKGIKTGPLLPDHKLALSRVALGKLRGPYKGNSEYSTSAAKYHKRKQK